MQNQLDNILDSLVEDLMKDFPEKTDFEAAFMALRMNLTILVQSLAAIGMQGDGLHSDQLYGMCKGLAETVEWMAAKEMAAETMRDIEKDL